MIKWPLSFLFISVFVCTPLVQAQGFDSSFGLTQSWTPPVFENDTKKIFQTPDDLKEEVDFWVKIYTQYTTQQGVFHKAGDITHILGEIDLSAIFANPQWGPIRKEKQAELFVKQERIKLAKKLRIKDPKKIRLQMGLKDRMQTAIFESGKYLPMMEKLFQEKNLPIELTRIVFVESSFNVNAQSKVGASGLWQIMPIIGKKFKYLKPSFDKRNHPEYATKCAIEILRQNYQILKSWPLAVTSYNFGVGSMLKVKRKMMASDADDIFGSKDLKKHIGFASRNFYATFLAALHVESKANLYFGEPLMIGQPIRTENIYLSQKMTISDFIGKHNLTYQAFKSSNPHIFKKYFKASGTLVSLPKGTLVSRPILARAKTAINQDEN